MAFDRLKDQLKAPATQAVNISVIALGVALLALLVVIVGGAHRGR